MKRWTEEEDNFIKDNYLTMTDEEIAEKLDRGIQSVAHRRCRVLHLKKELGYNNKVFTDEQIEFLKANANIKTLKDLTMALNLKFNTNFSEQQISNKLPYLGLNRLKLSKEQRCKIQHENAPYQIGYEYIDNLGFILVKTQNEQGNKRKNYEYKHILEWKKHKGSIPDNYQFGFLDGDRSNCDINNLFIFPRKWSIYLNKQLCKKDSDPQIKITALMCCQLHFKCKDNFYLGKEAINEK